MANEKNGEMNIEKLYGLLTRQEKSKNKLIPLDEDFYEKCSVFIKNLEDELKQASNYKHEDFDIYEKLVLKKERALKQIKRIIEKLFKLRLKLLLSYAFFLAEKNKEVAIKGLTKEERELLSYLTDSLLKYRINVLKNVLEGKEISYLAEEDKKEEKKILVAIEDFVPQFIGSDFKIYGPFEPGEIANLPETSASILITKKKAENLEE